MNKQSKAAIVAFPKQVPILREEPIPPKPTRQKTDWRFTQTKSFWFSNLSIGAKGIYSILRCYCAKDGTAYPTLEQMRDASHLSINTVDKYLHELKDSGILGWSLFRDQFRQLRRLYTIYQNLAHAHTPKSTPLTVTIKQHLYKWPAWCKEGDTNGWGCADKPPKGE